MLDETSNLYLLEFLNKILVSCFNNRPQKRKYDIFYGNTLNACVRV